MPDYKEQLKEYAEMSSFLSGAKRDGQLGARVDPAVMPDLYNPSPSGLKVKNVYKSKISDEGYLYEYEKPTPTQAPKPAAPAAGSGMKVVTVTVKSGSNPNASRGAKLLVPNGVFVPKMVSEKDFDRTYKRYEDSYMKQESGYYKNNIPNA
jgi:hypothetical protein